MPDKVDRSSITIDLGGGVYQDVEMHDGPSRDILRSLSTRKSTTNKITLDDITKCATDMAKAEVNSRLYKKISFAVAVVAILIVVVNSAATFMTIQASKESHVTDGALVDLNGKPVHTKVANTYVPLTELPRQSIAFLDKMDHVTYSIGKSIEKRSVSGFTWHNSSSLALFLEPDGEMIIRDGIAFVNDRKHGRIDFIVQKRVSRRLQGTSLPTNKGAYTWEELVNRYNTEISAPGVEGNWRRLAVLDTTGLSTMVSWFGALYESEIAVKEAEDQATAALAATPCDSMSTQDVQAPQMGTTGRMVLTLQQEFNMEASMGDVQLLYLDFEDASSMNFKLVQRATLSTKDVDAGGWPQFMAVTEMVAGSVYHYELCHPKSEIKGYDLQSHRALEEALNDPSDTNGLKAAKAVLESDKFNAYKDTCGSKSIEVVEVVEAGLDDQQPIDCNRGRFRWNVGGWILETTPDGQIVGLDAAEGAQHFEVIDVSYPAHHIDFSGCTGAPEDVANSSRRLSPEDAPPKHLSDGRRLITAAQLGHALSNTLWCGPGDDTTNKNTPCPDSNRGGSYDLKADRACRRHDHAIKIWKGWGIVKLSCDVDHDLAKDTLHNWAVQAVFGASGAARFWGCYDYGPHSCWGFSIRRRWWGNWGWQTCNGEHTQYGSDRYSRGYSHTYGYRAYNAATEQKCPDDCEMASRRRNPWPYARANLARGSACLPCDESLSGNGAGYRGCQGITRSGKTCQSWNSQSPHRHSRTPGNYPNSGLTDNLCRNPDGERSIWCYTTSSTRWELCDPK